MQAQVITVLDQETAEPLILATIQSQNSNFFVTTDEQGKADLSELHRTDTVEIRLLGYKTEICSFDQLKKASYVVQLFHTGLSLDDIVVTATRIRQDSRVLPYQVSTLSSTDVQMQNPQTAADLLAISGNVFIQKSQQGGGSPMIRGFATNRLLYAVDGVRMNTAIFRSGNLQNVISLDPFTIQKTDVYFGPGSVIYGSDAIGGVMSFSTLEPKISNLESLQIGGSATLRHATANKEKTGHAHISISKRKWAILSSISHSDFDDLKMGKHGPEGYLRPFYIQRQNGEDLVVENADDQLQIPSGYSQLNLMQKFKFQPSEKWSLCYGFHYSRTSSFSRYDRHLRHQDGIPRYGQWDYGPQKWLMNHLQVNNKSKGPLFNDVVIRLAHQEFEESRIDRKFSDPILRTRTEKVKAYSANIDLLKKISNNQYLFYGVEAVWNKVQSLGSTQNLVTGLSNEGPSRYPEADWTSLGAYFTYQRNISANLSWQGGLRYNQNSTDAKFDTTFYPFPYVKANISNHSLTGSLGLVFNPSKSLVLSLNAATGFRAPNVDDMGKVFDSEPGSVVVPNPGLEGEIAYNFEFGVAKLIGDLLKLDFSVYYTILDNAMVRRNFSLNGEDSIMYDGVLSQVQAVQNAAQAYVFGVQAGIELRLPAGIILTSDINLQKGEEETDNGVSSPSRHAPPTYGVTRLKYSSDRFEFQAYAIYSGGKEYEDLALEERSKEEIYATDDDGLPYSPSWYTINLKATYALSESISVNLGLENITNQRYRPYSSGIAAAGRNLVVSMRANI